MDLDLGSRQVLPSLLHSNPSRTRGVNMEAVHLDFFHSTLLVVLAPSALSPAAGRFPVFLFPMATTERRENRALHGAEKRERGRR